MLDFVVQPRLCRGSPPDELVHSHFLPWLVRAIRREEEYSGLAQSSAVIQALDAYGADPWKTLEQSGLFEPGRVLEVRKACLYDGQHPAFFPTALCSPEEPLPVHAPTHLTANELAHYHERAMLGLAAGRYPVSKAARDCLGTGYSSKLTEQRGISLVGLMEVALSNGSSLLGWGWLWHPRKRATRH